MYIVKCSYLNKRYLTYRRAFLIHGDLHRGELVGGGLGVLRHLGVLARVDHAPEQVVRIPDPPHTILSHQCSGTFYILDRVGAGEEITM